MIKVKFVCDFANLLSGSTGWFSKQRAIALLKSGFVTFVDQADLKWLDQSQPAKTS